MEPNVCTNSQYHVPVLLPTTTIVIIRMVLRKHGSE